MEPTSGTKPAGGFMENSIGGKTLSEYLKIIKMPLLALIAMDIVGFLLGFLTYIPAIGFIFAMLNMVIGLVLFVITVVIAGYIGYTAVKKYSGDLLTSLAAGAIAGLLSGIVSAVLNVISALAGLGMSPGIGQAVFMGTALVGLILSPVFGAVVGGILATIGGAVAGARTFGSPAPQPAAKN
ncbi:MAG: hypothetical protein WAX07_05470 [Candidatus Altiarchaeia archaeon]